MTLRPVRFRYKVLLALAISIAHPWQATVRADIHADPDAIALRFQLAQTAAASGDYYRAEQEYAALMLSDPNNVDYVFGYAQVMVWTHQEHRAIQFLRAARKLAPRYEDVWRLELQVRRAQPDSASDAELDDFLREVEARFPDATWRQVSSAAASTHFHWDVAANREFIDDGSKDWQQFTATLGWTPADNGTISVSAGHLGRFAQEDTYIGVHAAHRTRHRWTFAAGVQSSSSPAFMPRRELNLQMARQLRHGWVVHANWWRRDYDLDPVVMTGIGLDKYVRNFHLSYTLQKSLLAQESGYVHKVAANYFAPSGARFGVIAAAGNEIEMVGLDQLTGTDVSSFVLAGRHPIRIPLQIGWQIGMHRQGQLYKRHLIGMSVSGEF